jgi:hypothetical protein
MGVRWVFRGVFVECSEGCSWGVQRDVRGLLEGCFFLGCSEGEYESIKESPKISRISYRYFVPIAMA